MKSPRARVLADRHGYAAVPVGLLVVLLIIAAVRGPDLFTNSGAAGAIVNFAPLIMATLALTPVAIAGRGGVDLSIGPLLSLVNAILIQWLVHHGVTSPVIIIAAALGVAIAVEVIQGALIATLRLQPIIVMLSGYLVFSGLDLTIMQQPGGSAPGWLSGWGNATSILCPVLAVIVIALTVWTLISRSTFFRNVRMMGSNERTAYASGVSLLTTRIGAHFIAGLFAGLGGLLYTALISSGDPTFGPTYTLEVVTALLLGGISVAGGRGGAIGAVVGALDVFLISYVLATFHFGNSSSYVVELAYGLVLVGALGIGIVFNVIRTKRREVSSGAVEVAT